MSELKREWFEPGPDGVSPFDDYYLNFSGGTGGSAIAAAFRALLAGEAAPVDKDAKDAEIAELRAEVERWKSIAEAHEQNYKAMLRRLDEVGRLKNECSDQQSYVLDLESAIARKDTRIKVLEVANDSLTQYSSNLTAERDALQARIDAGVMAWDNWKQQCGSLWLWAFPGATASQAWSDVCDALDGSYTPLDHIADPGKMVDERKLVANILANT